MAQVKICATFRLDNLSKVCSEIFGEENYCGTFIWEKKKKPSFLSANMGSITDYIICFAKDRSFSPPFGAGAVEDGKKYPFNNAGNGIQTLTFPAGSVRFSMPNQKISPRDMSEGNIKTELLDDLVISEGKNLNEFRLRGEWRYSQSKLNEFVSDKAEIIISKIPFRPNYVNRSGELKKTANLLSHRTNGIPTNEDATEEMRGLFGCDAMSHPKPSGLLKYLVRSVTSSNDIVMDFFAGSGTTAHGCWLQNIEDNAQRRIILVQLPEPITPDTPEGASAIEYCKKRKIPANIAEVCKERLRLTANALKKSTPSYKGDFGFKVFKLDTSNIRSWEPNPDDLPASLLDAAEHIKDGRSEDDILFELLLKLGLDLATPIEKKSIDGKTVHSIGAGALLVCLATSITQPEVEALALGMIAWHEEQAPAGETTVVFRDSAFADDVAKTNIAAILGQHGLTTVRSL